MEAKKHLEHVMEDNADVDLSARKHKRKGSEDAESSDSEDDSFLQGIRKKEEKKREVQRMRERDGFASLLSKNVKGNIFTAKVGQTITSALR